MHSARSAGEPGSESSMESTIVALNIYLNEIKQRVPKRFIDEALRCISRIRGSGTIDERLLDELEDALKHLREARARLVELSKRYDERVRELRV